MQNVSEYLLFGAQGRFGKPELSVWYAMTAYRGVEPKLHSPICRHGVDRDNSTFLFNRYNTVKCTGTPNRPSEDLEWNWTLSGREWSSLHS
jgi:hypothetical protein